MNTAQKVNVCRASAAVLFVVLLAFVAQPASMADHHEEEGARVTLPVTVDGLRFASKSSVNALVMRSTDGELVSSQEKKVKRCRQSDEACERARAVRFEFKKLHLGTEYVIVVCHIDRKESGCPRNAKGETVDVGHVNGFVLTEDPGHLVDAEGIEVIVLVEDSDPYVINLKDEY